MYMAKVVPHDKVLSSSFEQSSGAVDLRDIEQFGVQNPFERAFVLKTTLGKKIQVEILDARLKEFLTEQEIIKAIQAYLNQERAEAQEEDNKQEQLQDFSSYVYENKSSSKDADRLALDSAFKEFLKLVVDFSHKIQNELKRETEIETEFADESEVAYQLEALQSGIPSLVSEELIPDTQNESRVSERASKGTVNSSLLANLLKKLQYINELEQAHLVRQQQRALVERAKWEKILGQSLVYQNELDNFYTRYERFSDALAQRNECRTQSALFFSQTRQIQNRVSYWNDAATNTRGPVLESLTSYKTLLQKMMDNSMNPGRHAATVFGANAPRRSIESIESLDNHVHTPFNTTLVLSPYRTK